MEYNFDIDYKIKGKVIVPTIPCKAFIKVGGIAHEPYIDNVQVEAIDGSYVDPDKFMEAYIRNELRTRDHEDAIYRLLDLGEAA